MRKGLEMNQALILSGLNPKYSGFNIESNLKSWKKHPRVMSVAPCASLAIVVGLTTRC
jgi:hypothetical protein